MSLVKPTEVLSHWNTRIEGLQQSADEFYTETAVNLGKHQLKKVQLERVSLSEGGVFSAHREYLQIRFEQFVYHVCAAPYGDGFFVSSWLGEKQGGFIAWLTTIPYIGRVVAFIAGLIMVLFKPMTYYKIDTLQMFHSVVHGAVTTALDRVIQAKGLRPLSDADRKPVMRDVLSLLK